MRPSGPPKRLPSPVDFLAPLLPGQLTAPALATAFPLARCPPLDLPATAANWPCRCWLECCRWCGCRRCRRQFALATHIVDEGLDCLIPQLRRHRGTHRLTRAADHGVDCLLLVGIAGRLP